jgi:hypothetical protein
MGDQANMCLHNIYIHLFFKDDVTVSDYIASNDIISSESVMERIR